MEKLKRAESYLLAVERAALVALLGFMTTLAFVQVARRQLFGTGALWADTLLRYLVLWVGFLGAALAAADEKHFAWEAAAQAGGKKGALMKMAAHAAAVAISGFLLKASWRFFLDEKASGKVLFEIGHWNFQSWVFALAIPVGFALVMVHMTLRAVHAADELRK